MKSERRKHGEICPITQRVFWSYDSDGRERWFSPERFAAQKEKSRATQRRRYWANLDESRLRLRDWHHANKDKKKQNFKNWIAKNKGHVRNRRIFAVYGLTSEDYFKMVEDQKGVCAICGNEQQGSTKDGDSRYLCVDHCHDTGNIRGLLCVKCNAGLGQFMDNPENLRKAADYLESVQILRLLPEHQTQGMQS